MQQWLRSLLLIVIWILVATSLYACSVDMVPEAPSGQGEKDGVSETVPADSEDSETQGPVIVDDDSASPGDSDIVSPPDSDTQGSADIDVDGDTDADADADGDTDADMDIDGDADTDEREDTEWIPDSDTDADVTTDDDDSGSHYRKGIYGFVDIDVFRYHDFFGHSESFSIWAQFFEVTGDVYDIDSSVIVDAQEGVDDCGLVMDDGISTGWGEETVSWWNAGTATLSFDGQSLELEQWGETPVNYTLGMSDLGYSPQYGKEYIFRATGGDAPPMKLAMTLPEDIAVSIPHTLAGAPLPQDDLVLTWSGSTGDGEVRILYDAGRYEGATSGGYSIYPPYYTVTCVAADDGEFTIPGSILSMIPENLSARLTVIRANRSVVDIAEDMAVDVTAFIDETHVLNLPDAPDDDVPIEEP